MESSGTKLICYTSRKSSRLCKAVHTAGESPSNKKNLWKFSFHKRCRSKRGSFLNKRGKRRSFLNGETVDTMRGICSHSAVKGQNCSQLMANKISRRRHQGKPRIAADGAPVRSDKRRRRKKKQKNVERDEASRLQRRTRYLLIKMKLEQNLIDAYSGDGWKGQSREKIKPEKELQRAKKQIMKCKLGIRDAIRQLDLLSYSGSVAGSMVQTNGSTHHELIFCATCRSSETFQGNAILVCNGTCNCGFHQNCLEPPLEQVTPGDQPWLCRFCQCKFEILGAINAHLGTSFSVKNSWEDIFKESTACSDDAGTNAEPAEDWPSEDSQDEDYNPETKESSSSKTGNEEDISDASNCSNSLLYSSDEDMAYPQQENYRCEGSFCSTSKSKKKFELLDSMVDIDSLQTNEIMSYRRQRKDVDYKKLYDEMFGKELSENDPQSEDDDWGPNRRKRRRVEANPSTHMVNCTNDNCCSENSVREKQHCDKRQLFRIPPYAVEKLRLAFAENELPSRAAKESLSKQLGISSEKVSKWFKNARYAALKMRKAEMATPDQTSTASERLETTAARANSSHQVVSLDSSCLLPLSSIIRVPKKLTKILRKRYPASEAAAPSNEQNIIAIKKLASIRSQRTKITNRNLRKEINSHGEVDKTAGNEQLFLAEIEKLCRVQDRLQNLKKALQSSLMNDLVPYDIDSREQNVIYVPIAEVKVKR